MGKGIGTIILNLREEKGYSQEQICEGICSQSQMGRIEQNESVPDYFVLDRLFERLGKSTERLEYVLSKEVYELYELQYLIQTEILHQDFKEAEKLLEQYERKKKTEQPLHRQFAAQERAQIAWMRGESKDIVLKYLNSAISETMRFDGFWKKETELAGDELKLLLFRWEVSRETKNKRDVQEVKEILNYIEKRDYDAEIAVKVYPYAVILLCENLEIQGTYELEYLIEIAGKALELLRNEAKILYLPEIIELYTGLLEERGIQEKWIWELREMRKSLLEIEEEFGVHFERYRLFQHFNRTFELDYEVIRNTRIAYGISQEELCEEICTQETLSRIERGKCAPSNKNIKLLLEKLERNRERVGMNIVAERYEQIALEKKIAVAYEKRNIEKAKKLSEELQTQLDLSIIKNKQYVCIEQVRMKFQEGIYSCEQGIEKLYEILSMTLPENNENIFSYNLTYCEKNILNHIAVLLCKTNQVEKGIELWRKILRNYERKMVHKAFYLRDWELISQNMAGRMEESGYIEEPIRICMENLKIELEVGKGNGMGRSLAIIACVLEHQNDKECIVRFRQTLNIYRLMKINYRYQCMKEYVKEKGIEIEES